MTFCGKSGSDFKYGFQKDFKYEQNSDMAWKESNLLSEATLKPQVLLRYGKSIRYSTIYS